MHTTIITYGTFDLFHAGHVELLKRARSLGSRLIVGISTDEFNEVKGKTSVVSYKDRALIVSSCRYVDDIFPENNWEQKPEDIRKFKADVFTMGSDWQGKFDHLNQLCDVIYLPRTEGISSTLLKKRTYSIISQQ
jgi:glycerol-3-phosphate cytidylyltransferase